MTERWIESGDPAWPVWLVAEAPGAEEIAAGRPLVGQSGQELDRMLAEAGWPRPDRLFRTNVCHERPPSYTRNGKPVHNDINQFFLGKVAAHRAGTEHYAGRYPTLPIRAGIDRLNRLLEEQRPQLIITLGATPLWALAGREGVTKWRGSVLAESTHGLKLLSTFHPADVLRTWEHRPIVVQDLRRALRESETATIHRSEWELTVAPSVADVRDWLLPHIEARTPLVCDTEGWGVVDCIGFADSSTRALCIPFIHETPRAGESINYWSIEDEVAVTALVLQALTVCPITFHNGLWDVQVLARTYGVCPQFVDDTQVMQHVSFPGLLGGRIDPVTGSVDKRGSSLSLSFIASMYCEHYSYWKDDGRHFDPSTGDELDYWAYNCEDCCRTWECRSALVHVLTQSRLWQQYRLEMSLFGPVFKMMFTGLRKDRTRVREIRQQINTALAAERQWLSDALGFPLNVKSSKQMRALFYDDLGCAVIKDRKTGAPTLADTALTAIATRQPLLQPLCTKIQNIRSLLQVGDPEPRDNEPKGLLAALEEPSDRLRCALNIAFVETMRFSSNETAFGEGTNLQNLPRPVKD